MAKIDKINVKVNGTVFHITGSKYKVISIDVDKPNGIRLESKIGSIMFTDFNKNEHGIYEWFTSKPKTPTTNRAYCVVIPDIPVDTIVYVYTNGDWKPRYFSNFGKEGECYVFARGASSITTDGSTTIAKRYRLDKPIKVQKL